MRFNRILTQTSMSYSYYRKVMVWTLMTTAGSATMAWALGCDPPWYIVASAHVPMTLTLYPVFEYYWSWTPEHPCLIN
jgi:hypothetical protein